MNGQLKRNIQKAFKTPELDEQKKAEFLKFLNPQLVCGNLY